MLPEAEGFGKVTHSLCSSCSSYNSCLCKDCLSAKASSRMQPQAQVVNGMTG